MKENHITESNIRQLVNNFYTRVRKDKLLSPIFKQTIGDGLEVWKPHLQTMYDFWTSVMLGGGHYQGNPLQKHQMLPSFDIKLFDRWLVLFEEAARELYTEEIANHYVEKSKRIAESLKLGLYYRP